jgi:hypothetical protein
VSMETCDPNSEVHLTHHARIRQSKIQNPKLRESKIDLTVPI